MVVAIRQMPIVDIFHSCLVACIEIPRSLPGRRDASYRHDEQADEEIQKLGVSVMCKMHSALRKEKQRERRVRKCSAEMKRGSPKASSFNLERETSHALER